MFCESCGTKLPEGAKFCGACGATVETSPPANAAPQKPAATSPAPPPPTYTPPPVEVPPSYQQGYAQPLPPNYPIQTNTEPLRVGQYIGMFLLLCIPIVNLILLLVWSFGSSVNRNKKNYARAILILSVIAIVISIIFGAALISALVGLLNNLSW
jgi:hypothetical protein